MIEPILLSEQNEAEEQPRQKTTGACQWMMFLAFSILLAGAVIGLVMHFDQPEQDSQPSTPPILTSPQSTEVCGACTIIPGMESHVICKSCKWNKLESKDLSCPSGYGSMEFQSVKIGGKTNAQAMAALQSECSKQFQETAGETCSFMLDTLLNGQVDEVASEPVLEKHHHPKDPNSVKAQYTCHKIESEILENDTDVYSEEEPIKLQSALLNEPFLSSVLVKCDKRKQIADTVEMSKLCAASGASSMEFSCPSGSDPRIIVLKMQQISPPALTKGQKKMNKKRGQMITNYCAAGNMNGASCSVAPENFLLDTEESLDGFTWDVKYMCSYGDTAGSLLLSKSLDLSGRASEQPSEPILESALVKCGKRKSFSSTVEVAKVCSDRDFELTCNTNGDPRVIVLSMWEGSRSEKSNKDAKRRASLATDVCAGDNFVDGVCSFSVEDVALEEDKAADLTVDPTFTVKYLCSYDTPIIDYTEVPVEEPSE